MFNIFEKPWALLIVAIVVLLVIYIIRAFKTDKRQWWHLFIPIMIAISAFATDIIVETDQENINNVIKSCIEASRNEDADTIDTFIASDYHFLQSHILGTSSRKICKTKSIHRAVIIKRNSPY